MRTLIVLTLIFTSIMSEAKLTTDLTAANLDNAQGVSINTDDSTSCFPPKLLGFIDEIRTRFGSIEINSGYRSRSHNRQVGGVRGSQHMSCTAIDFKIPGVPKAEVKAFLSANFSGRAGVGYYCNDRFHVDAGNPRQWGGCQPTSAQASAAKIKYSNYLANRRNTPRVQTASTYGEVNNNPLYHDHTVSQ